MYTKHGHHIPGTTVVESEEVFPVARCGGPGLCNECSVESVTSLPNVDISTPVIGETHTDATLDKVYAALTKAVGKTQASVCINEMQNAGILFRERSE